MTTSNLPKRILTLGMPSDYPPEFREISAACDFAIAAAPDGQVSVVKDRHGVVPRQPTLRELTSVGVVTPADCARILGGGNGERPAPRFAEGDRITPGPNSTLGLDVGAIGEVTDRRWCGNCAGWHYLVRFEGGEAQMLEARMLPAEENESGPRHASPRDGEPEAIEAPQPDGWQGTEPAEGTRRATVLSVLRNLGSEEGTRVTPLEVADRIESALLEQTIAEEAEDGYEDVATEDFPPFDVIEDEGKIYVSVPSLVGIFEHLLTALADAEIEEEDRDEAPADQPVSGGRSGGKTAAMVAALREDAASDEDAEAAVADLEQHGRAFLGADGKHMPIADVPPEAERRPLASLLDLLPSIRRNSRHG